MEPERSGAKPGGGPREATGGRLARGQGAVAVRRVYPKPPGLLKRFVRLCLMPEAWAESGRYPFHVTLMPLILAVLLGAILFGVAQASQMMSYLRTFATTYDAHYPPVLVDSEGTVSRSWWVNPQPMRIFSSQEMVVLVDPLSQVKPEDIQTPIAYVFTGKDLKIRILDQERTNSIRDTFREMLPARGEVIAINGARLQSFVETDGRAFALLVFGGGFLFKLLSGVLWSATMILVNFPLAMIAARTGEAPMGIPRRGAIRFAAAVLIPLHVVGGVLEAVGYSLRETVGPQAELLIWFVAAGALCFWTGKMAKDMYGVKRARGQ